MAHSNPLPLANNQQNISNALGQPPASASEVPPSQIRAKPCQVRNMRDLTLAHKRRENWR